MAETLNDIFLVDEAASIFRGQVGGRVDMGVRAQAHGRDELHGLRHVVRDHAKTHFEIVSFRVGFIAVAEVPWDDAAGHWVIGCTF